MNPVLDQLAAKKRIRRFFDEPIAERRAVSRFIEQVSVCADVFVFGGALRDISLLGAPRFSSDIDIVVRIQDDDAFATMLDRFDAAQNKFGGHRVRLDRWNFDVWEVSRTWAFSVGAVEARSHLSLLETPFFNWDAILYDWRSGSLHHGQSYFSELSEMYLELVLEDNPNSLGAFVRALRALCLSDDISTGPRLTRFIREKLLEISNDVILLHERKSFSNARLSTQLLADLRVTASTWKGEGKFRWFPNKQLSFFDEPLPLLTST